MIRFITLVVSCFVCLIDSAIAEVVAVEPTATGLFRSSEPTLTFHWGASDPRAVLIMIPGGEGHIGLTRERQDLGGFYRRALKPLSDASETSGTLDVVVFDSPYPLPAGDVYPTSRGSSDHLDRIESVVRYWRDKLGKPVWLMGHSNGAISVAEFLREKGDIVDGVIVSSSRNGIKVPDDTALPVLFLHHRNDACSKSAPQRASAAFDDLRSASRSAASFNWIEGGRPEPGNPCASGFHMYFGAELDAAKAIDSFISAHTR